MKDINFDQLKKDHDNFKEVINGYEDSYKKLQLFKDLREHEGMKILIKNFKDEIDYLNKVLCNNRNLTDDQRKEIFIKKDQAKFIVELFEGIENEEKNIEQGIDNLQAGK
jgi:type I site-specific restriction-modification system R (restriction) subunit